MCQRRKVVEAKARRERVEQSADGFVCEHSHGWDFSDATSSCLSPLAAQERAANSSLFRWRLSSISCCATAPFDLPALPSTSCNPPDVHLIRTATHLSDEGYKGLRWETPSDDLKSVHPEKLTRRCRAVRR